MRFLSTFEVSYKNALYKFTDIIIIIIIIKMTERKRTRGRKREESVPWVQNVSPVLLRLVDDCASDRHLLAAYLIG